MTKTVRCARCGKELVLEGKQIKETVACDHCHQQMRIDERSQKRFKAVRYFFVLAICIIIAVGMRFITQNNYLTLLVMLSMGLVLANSADRLCLLLTEMVFHLEYEAYTPVKLSNKDKLKQEKSRKKGLFR